MIECAWRVEVGIDNFLFPKETKSIEKRFSFKIHAKGKLRLPSMRHDIVGPSGDLSVEMHADIAFNAIVSMDGALRRQYL